MYFDHGLSINGYYMKYKLHYENRFDIKRKKEIKQSRKRK